MGDRGVRPPVMTAGGDVLPWGVFPSATLAARVLVPCVFNQSKWGCRALSPGELAKLWDVPLSLIAWAGEQRCPRLLEAFLSVTPGKGLVLGGDYLLASCVRGGGSRPTKE